MSKHLWRKTDFLWQRQTCFLHLNWPLCHLWRFDKSFLTIKALLRLYITVCDSCDRGPVWHIASANFEGEAESFWRHFFFSLVKVLLVMNNIKVFFCNIFLWYKIFSYILLYICRFQFDKNCHQNNFNLSPQPLCLVYARVNSFFQVILWNRSHIHQCFLWDTKKSLTTLHTAQWIGQNACI